MSQKQALYSGVSAVALTFTFVMSSSGAGVYAADLDQCRFEGAFGGIHGGGGSAWTVADEAGSGIIPFVNVNGGLLGVHVGYNTHCSHDNRFVAGVEADADLLLGWDEVIGSGSSTAHGDIDFLASVRGRIGVAIHDNTLLTASAGVAFSDAAHGTATAAFLHNVGAVVGVGVEHFLNDDWSIRAEGLYYLFGSKTFGTGSSLTLKLDVWTARLGLSKHF